MVIPDKISESPFVVAKVIDLPNSDAPMLFIQRLWEKPKKASRDDFFPLSLNNGNPNLLEGFHLVHKTNHESGGKYLPIFVSTEVAGSYNEAKKIISAISNHTLHYFMPEVICLTDNKKTTHKKNVAQPQISGIQERSEQISLNMFNRKIKAELRREKHVCLGKTIWAVTLVPLSN